MTDQHPSRRSWPAMPGPTIVNRQRRISLAVLYIAVAINMVFTSLVFSYVQVLKHDRDTEAARIKQHTDTAICDLLDQFPADGVLLERPRTKYHCGPGLPATATP